jgi:hypothetical protein
MMATWTNPQAFWRCWGSWRSTDGNWSAPQAIDTDNMTPGSFGLPFPTVSGQFAVIGKQNIANSSSIVWINLYDPLTGWGAAEPVQAPPGYVSDLQVSRNAAGFAVATWRASSATGFGGVQDAWWSRFR